MIRSSLAGAALAAALLATPAHADTTPGTAIAQVMVLEPGDASYALFHGAIWLDADKATWNYRWGGLQCKGRDVSDNSVQLLFAAFRAGDSVSVEYVVSELKGKQYRCLTGFTVSKA
jgi:hypothetical protein